MSRSRSWLPLLALALGATSGLFAQNAEVKGLADTLLSQAEALHAAAQPPEDGPRPPRFRNWMLRKEIKNFKGLAKQLGILAARTKPRKILMRAQFVNLQMTQQRIQFGIVSGGARHLDGVKPALGACKETMKALHQSLYRKGKAPPPSQDEEISEPAPPPASQFEPTPEPAPEPEPEVEPAPEPELEPTLEPEGEEQEEPTPAAMDEGSEDDSEPEPMGALDDEGSALDEDEAFLRDQM